MKKLLILLLCITMLMCGCSSGTDTATSDGSEIPAPEENIPLDDFYKLATSSIRPIAVMIDNDSEASRPQIGLEDAYLVYEIIVEGGASRIMALFKNHTIEKIGPVRSSRHYFLDYALENGAIYAHAGWSPQAQKDISSLKVNNINGIVGNDGKNFWRDNTYDSTYHNLYTSAKKLSEYAKNEKNYIMRANNGPVVFAKKDAAPDGTDCTNLSFRYSGMYGVSYTYNADDGIYERYINGKPHVSQTGETFTAKNIIVYNVPNFDLKDGENKGRQNLDNIGSGEGWYVSLGKAEKITWSKKSRTGKTEYKKADGSALEVNPGITYIQIIPKDNAVTIQ